MSEEATEASTEVAPITADKVVDERGVPITNVLKEVTRKLGRINEVNAKLDMLLQNNVQSPAAVKAQTGVESVSGSTDLAARIKALEVDKLADRERAQKAALDTVFKTFPELDRDSESFDSQFFDLAVEYENAIDIKDPQRPLKAAKLAALDLGKTEKLIKSKVLQDESRRLQKLSEGAAPTKDQKAGKPEMKMNKSAISRYLKVDPKMVEKYAKGEDD